MRFVKGVFTMRRIYAAIALSLVISLPPTASLSIAQEEAVVVTATRFPSRTTSVVNDISVIDKEAIQRAGHSTLAELLQTQPGIEIVTNGGMGQPSGISIRGANVTQTLVIVDGLRIGSATAGQAALEQIPISQIDRIEILRGPASSLYGADALGGVIQIFTRRGSGPPKMNFSFGYGTYGTTQGSAGVTGQTGDTR
jgi:vitamin B12 transporter